MRILAGTLPLICYPSENNHNSNYFSKKTYFFQTDSEPLLYKHIKITLSG